MKRQEIPKKKRGIAKRGLALLLAVAMMGNGNIASIPVLAADAVTQEETSITPDENTVVTPDSDTTTEVVTEEGKAGTTETEGVGTEIPAEPEATTEPATEDTTVRMSKDWTNDATQMNLLIASLVYKETGAEAPVQVLAVKDEAGAYRADLTAMNAYNLESLTIELGFDLVPAIAEKQIQPGDTLTYTLPVNMLNLTDTTEPVAVMNRDVADNNIELADQIATYEIKDNVVKVTFTDGVNAETATNIIGRISLPITLNTAALSSEQTTEATFALQTNEKQAVNTSCVITLPQAAATETTEDADAIDTPVTDGAVTDENDVTDEAEKDADVDTVDENTVDKNIDESNQDNADADSIIEETDKTQEEVAVTEDSASNSFVEGIKAIPRRVASFFSSLFAAKAATTATKTDIKNPTDGITNIRLTISNNSEGYTHDTTDENAKVNLGLKITADNDYLLNQLSTTIQILPGYPEYSEDDYATYDDYLDAVDEFLNANKESLPQVAYTLDLGSTSDFILPAEIDEDTEVPLRDEFYDVIANYTIKEVDGRYKMEIKMEPIVFNRSLDPISYNLEYSVDAEKINEGDSKFVEYKDGEVILTDKPNSGEGGENPPATPDYTIEKDAPSSVTSPYIDYEIHVQTNNDKTLLGSTGEGMVFEDQIPEGLVFDSIEFYCVVNGVEQPYVTEPDDVSIEDGKIYYNYKRVHDYTEAVIKIRLRLDDENYAAYMESGVFDKKFDNQAAFYDSATPDDKVYSNTTSTDMKLQMLDKDGIAAGLNGSRFQWSIEANTNTGGVANEWNIDTFVIDKLNLKAHTYEKNTGVQYYADGKYAETRTIQDIDELGLSDEDKNALIKAYQSYADDTGAAGSTLAAIFEKYGMVNPISFSVNADPVSGGKNGTEISADAEQIMIIPFNQYTDKDVQFKYYTDANYKAQGYASLDEWIAAASAGTGAEVTMDNDATLAWKWNFEGTGPEPWNPPSFTGSVSKTHTTHIVLGEKSAQNYDADTQTQSWVVKVNEFGVNMTNTVITDTFAKSTYSLDEGSVRYIKYDNATGRVLDQGEVSNKTVTSDDENTTLTINLGTVNKSEYYEIYFDTKVIDGSILGTQGVEKTLSNNVTINANVAGQPAETKTTADKKITTTLIKKDVVQNFSYADHSIGWQITVNPNHIPLENGVVTDPLPEGNGFASIEAATLTKKNEDGTTTEVSSTLTDKTGTSGTITFADGTSVTWNVTDNTTESGYSKDTLKFTLPPTGSDEDATYSFQVKTVMDQQYIDDNLKTNTDNVSVDNKATLNGTVYSVPVVADDAADAVAELEKPQITKEGTYDAEDGKISWMVVLNKEKADLSGMVLKEELSSVLELDIDTVKLYYTDQVSADGTVDTDTASMTEVSKEDQEEKFLIVPSYEGFSITVPDDDTYRHQVLVATFDTYLTDDATKSDIQNQVKLYIGEEEAQESNTSDGGMTDDYDVEDHVGSSKRPMLLVNKTSSTDGKPFPLEGATYEIKPYNVDSQGNLTENTTIAPKHVSTKATGNAAFVNLAPNVVYALYETKAPAGYAVDPKATYYRFTNSDSTSVSEDYTLDGEVIEVNVIAQNAGKYSAETIRKTDNLEIEDNSVSFKKVGPDGTTPLNGAKFQLERYIGTELKTFESNASVDGVVTFTGVDPGNYVLREIESGSVGMQSGATFDVTLAADADGNLSFTKFEGTSELATVSATDNTYTVIDKQTTGTIRIRKVDANATGKGLSGGAFDLYAIPATGDAVKVNETAVAADADGYVTFEKVPYNYFDANAENPSAYEISEVSAPVGYTLTDTPLSITADMITKAASAGTEENGYVNSFNVDVENTVFTDAEKTQLTMTNTRANAVVKIKKTFLNGAPDFTGMTQEEIDAELTRYQFTLNYAGQDGYRDDYDSWDSDFYVAIGTLKYSETDGFQIVFDTAGRKPGQPPLPYGTYNLVEYIYTTVEGATTHRGEADARFMAQNMIISEKDWVLTEDGTYEADIQIENKFRTADLQVRKTQTLLKGESYEQTTGLGEVSFQLLDEAKENVVARATSDLDGDLTFKDVTIGTYYLHEVAKPGYRAAEDIKVILRPESETTYDPDRVRVQIYYVNADGEEVRLRNGESVAVDNTPIKGSISFYKMDTSNKFAAAGTEFEIFRIIGSRKISMGTAKADKDGLVQFENLEYGKYQIVETNAGTGFKDDNKVSFVVKPSDLTVTAGTDGAEDTFTYAKGTKEDAKTNEVISADVKLVKKDQDGNTRAGAMFYILRLASGGNDADGTGMVVDVSKEDLSWSNYPEGYDGPWVFYQPRENVTSGENGAISIDNLPYGIYRLQETGFDSELSGGLA
ncbi:MAG: SpaA isopeptide-forming pilin-related protein [Lachnospiraceae bacterium]|nr:SpaA isopeptide-forming pilin-related protein [Lachnospiraceae bacterium]MDD3616367.1 SpaA isopeptide-forming pilin-related protein [Lachnospiraceae bacterium]